MLEKVRNWIYSNDKLALLERKFAVTTNPNFSISKVLLTKLRVLSEFIFRSLFESKPPTNWRKDLYEFRERKFPSKCLVLANGPSLALLRPKEIIDLQNRRKIDIFAVYNFLLSPMAKKITPDFLCLSDPAHIPNSTDESLHFWDAIRQRSETVLILPKHWHQFVVDNKIKNKCLFFDDRSLELWSKSTSPTKPRGYMSLTALKGLAFATWLPYKQIFILGFDNSMYQTLNVDDQNRLWQGSNHAEGTANIDNTDMSKFYPNGVSDYFFDLSQIFINFKLFSKSKKVFNLDSVSVTDSFPKVPMSSLICSQEEL